jgi:hypothetical protein
MIIRKELPYFTGMLLFSGLHDGAASILLGMWGFDPNRSVTIRVDNENDRYIVEQNTKKVIRGHRAGMIILDEEL